MQILKEQINKINIPQNMVEILHNAKKELENEKSIKNLLNFFLFILKELNKLYIYTYILIIICSIYRKKSIHGHKCHKFKEDFSTA